jgi:hypothetical protein
VDRYFANILPTHLRDTVFHNLLASEIGLVANKQLVNTLRGVSVNLLQPLLDVREGIFVIEVRWQSCKDQ